MQPITISVSIDAPRDRVWEIYTNPEHIIHWNAASADWYSPRATNDLRPGGEFSYRMEAKDGSEGFDFAGVFTDVVPPAALSYTFGGRTAAIAFTGSGAGTEVVVTFDPESEHSLELQRAGWQAILDNFKRYAEATA